MAELITFSATRARNLSDRRRDRRFLTLGGATLQWPGFNGEPCATQGLVTNVSLRGLTVDLHEPVRMGQTVDVRFESAAFRATIRSCCRYRGTFRTGLEIMGVPWQSGCADPLPLDA